MPPSALASRSWYRWVLVAVAFVAVAVSFGPVIVFTFGIFLKPLSNEFGWSRGEISLAFSLAAITVSFCSPLIGRWADRSGPRRVILVCATVYAAAFAALSLLSGKLWQLYATYIVIGAVGNGATQLPYSRFITEWFDRRRGLALSVMMSGVGAGIILMPTLGQTLIDDDGWRAAYRLLGLLMLLAAVPLPAVLLPGKPSSRPVQESGPDSQAGAASGLQGLTAGQALRGAAFWQILGCFFLFSVSINGCVAHFAPLLTDRGLPPQEAAMMASLLGAATLIGRLITGWLLDRYFAPWVCAASFSLAALGIAVLVGSAAPAAAGAAAVLMGYAMGAEADVMPYLVSRYFGLRAFTELYGYAFSGYAVAGALGPWLMGLSYDRSGDYRQVLLGFAVSVVAAVALLLRLPRYPSNLPRPDQLAWEGAAATESGNP
jgi:MFS family permease